MWLINQVLAPAFESLREAFVYAPNHPVIPIAAAAVVAVNALFATARRRNHR